jgi:hypothetical protein
MSNHIALASDEKPDEGGVRRAQPMVYHEMG